MVEVGIRNSVREHLGVSLDQSLMDFLLLRNLSTHAHTWLNTSSCFSVS